FAMSCRGTFLRCLTTWFLTRLPDGDRLRERVPLSARHQRLPRFAPPPHPPEPDRQGDARRPRDRPAYSPPPRPPPQLVQRGSAPLGGLREGEQRVGARAQRPRLRQPLPAVRALGEMSIDLAVLSQGEGAVQESVQRAFIHVRHASPHFRP